MTTSESWTTPLRSSQDADSARQETPRAAEQGPGQVDLHAALHAVISARLEVARAATPGPWTAEPVVYGSPEDGWGEPNNFEVQAPSRPVVSHQMHEGGGIDHEPDARHIALHDPADAIRRYSADLERLKRHRPAPAGRGGLLCTAEWADGDGWEVAWVDCAEIKDLIETYPEVPRA